MRRLLVRVHAFSQAADWLEASCAAGWTSGTLASSMCCSCWGSFTLTTCSSYALARCAFAALYVLAKAQQGRRSGNDAYRPTASCLHAT